jgi:hypothetical protein
MPAAAADAVAKGMSGMTLRSTIAVRRLALMSTLLALAACANTPAPVQEMAAAERAVQVAADADAETLAPVEFEKARRKLAAASSALQAQDHLEARQLAEQAVADAELAQVTASLREAERAATDLRVQIRDAERSAMPAAGS